MRNDVADSRGATIYAIFFMNYFLPLMHKSLIMSQL